MNAPEQDFEQACKERLIPGAVLAAHSTNGINYEKAFGVRSIKDGAPAEPLTTDSVFWIASCTKLMTSISAMQCVERGLLTLDQDIAKLIPSLGELEILDKFDDRGKAVLVKRKNPITLRHLLTHSSGLSYDAFHPKLIRWRQSRGEVLFAGRTLNEKFNCPLLFEPGASWQYSPAIDYVGRAVEQVTGQSLEEYMQKNIWQPLGIRDITFWIDKNADMKQRLADITNRDPQGSGKVVHSNDPTPNTGVTDCLGGQGCYATMPDYIKILRSLLYDDEKLLKKETAAQLFQPNLSSDAQKSLDGLRDTEAFASFPGNFPRKTGMDYGLGGIITTDSDEGYRGKNTLIWGGLPNLLWWVDRENGVCGIYGGAIFPPGDQQAREMITKFEKEVYRQVNTKSNSNL